MFNTEITFTLPYGYRDQNGDLHREGVMRMATAIDEIEPIENMMVSKNPAYFNIVLLSRVIIRLGGLFPVSTSIIERLFAADFIFLQDLYLEMNTGRGELHGMEELVETECPMCRHRFLVNISFLNNEEHSLSRGEVE
jgi:hypothetical protein